MKLIDVVNANKVLSEVGSKELPFALQHKIAKFIYTTENDVNFYREKWRTWLDAFYNKSEINPGEFILKEGIDIEESTKQMEEMNNVEIECPLFFTEEELKPLSITLPQMLILHKFIKE